MKHIMKCKTCNIYTMLDKCPSCNAKTVLPKPAKYSPEDRVGKYRLQAKIEMGIISEESSKDNNIEHKE